MKSPFRKPLDHEPPPWVCDASTYFITVCAEPRKRNHFCQPDLGSTILKSMPDHIHLLLSFPDLPSYSHKIGDWKHYLSRRHDIPWQENFFDHRLRDQENFDQKAEYILHNPVRAGLVSKAEDWPYTWMPGM